MHDEYYTQRRVELDARRDNTLATIGDTVNTIAAAVSLVLFLVALWVAFVLMAGTATAQEPPAPTPEQQLAAAAQEPPAPTPEQQLAAAADDLGAALAELDAALRERGVTTACVQP